MNGQFYLHCPVDPRQQRLLIGRNALGMEQRPMQHPLWPWARGAKQAGM
jgi:hypothetical protein